MAADVPIELGHAQQLAARVRVLEGMCPAAMASRILLPPKDSADVVSAIKGGIEAEDGAIAQYNKIIKLCEGSDYATQDLRISLLANEEAHRREFAGSYASTRKSFDSERKYKIQDRSEVSRWRPKILVSLSVIILPSAFNSQKFRTTLRKGRYDIEFRCRLDLHDTTPNDSQY